jgi:hypothetical protein
MDKKLLTFVGVPGSGKSTFLVHLPFSPQYLSYWKARQMDDKYPASSDRPLISLITFSGEMAMCHADEAAPFLRIIYGILKSSSAPVEKWSDFYKAFSSLNKFSAYGAVPLLHNVFGKDRLILIGVDDIELVEEAYGEKAVKYVTSQLRSVLESDIYTDVLLAGLPPSNLFSTPGNITTLAATNQSEVHHEFNLRSNYLKYIFHILLEIRKSFEVDIRLNPSYADECFLFAISLLLGNEFNITDYDILQLQLALSPLENMSPLEDPAEQEIMLSDRLINFNEPSEYLPRCMLEGVNSTKPRCFVFEATKDSRYRITTTMSMFVKMITTIASTNSTQLDVMTRTAQTLFDIHPDTFQWTEWWKRSYGMMMVAKAQKLLLAKETSIIDLCGVIDNKFGCNVKLTEGLKVAIANSTDDIKWSPNQIMMTPHDNIGFDLATCLVGLEQQEVWIFTKVELLMSYEDTNISHISGDHLFVTLVNFIHRNPILTAISCEEKADSLKHLYFVLSVYGNKLDMDKKTLKAEVVKYLSSKYITKDSETNLKMVLNFIENFWDTNMALQGTKEIEANMVPVLLPMAKLIQAKKFVLSCRER